MLSVEVRPNTVALSVGGRGCALTASVVLAITLAGCAHVADVVVSQAPAAAPGLVVFDIDGTLTPSVARIFWVRPDAAAAARLYARRGHRIVYLTARAVALQGTLGSYLARNGFPPGDLVAPGTGEEHARPAEFKARVLAGYRAHGWDVAAAYGDSTSDFEAYARADIPRQRVYARSGSARGTANPTLRWPACRNGRHTCRRLRPHASGERDRVNSSGPGFTVAAIV